MKTAEGATSFAARLTERMKAKGYVSTGTRSGVDVNALAKAADTSYEMARRYSEGKAIPRPETLARIAEWLGVEPSVLLYGEPIKEINRIIHTEVLQSCIEAVKRAEQLSGQQVPPEKQAKLIALLYEEALDGREVNTGLIPRLLRLI